LRVTGELLAAPQLTLKQQQLLKPASTQSSVLLSGYTNQLRHLHHHFILVLLLLLFNCL
jgi:hypothetical protein